MANSQIKKWRMGLSNDFPYDPERNESFLRVRPGSDRGDEIIETGCGCHAASRADFIKLFAFARRARKADEARKTRMKLGRQRYDVSATHQGDVRIGCQLFHWDELRKVAHKLGLPMRGAW